jgi:hypothetical protein
MKRKFRRPRNIRVDNSNAIKYGVVHVTVEGSDEHSYEPSSSSRESAFYNNRIINRF